MANTDFERWYQKPWVVLIFVVFLWPVGLVLVWLTNWKIPTKVGITITILLLVAYTYMKTGSIAVFF